MPKANQTAAPEADHHYYGSTAFHWATAPTRAQVLQDLGRMTGAHELKKYKEGLTVWTCRVLAPKSAEYRISNYAPQGVETDGVHSFKLMTVKGYCLPMDHKDDDK